MADAGHQVADLVVQRLGGRERQVVGIARVDEIHLPGQAGEATDTSAPAPAPAASAPAASAPAASAAGGPPRDQAYWSKRIAEARANVDRTQAFAQALQNRVDMLWTDFVNRGDPVQQRAIEQERNKALAELERVKKEVQDNQKVVAAIEDEARRDGVPAGWLRP